MSALSAKRRRDLILLAVAVAGFIAVSWLSRRYAPFLLEQDFFVGPYGRGIYVLLIVLAIVVAPLETFPLLPLAVTLWGPLTAAVLSILGYTVGSMAAFIIARHWGRSLAYRLVDPAAVDDLKRYLVGRRFFWLVVLTRLLLPVDVVSYTVGLFTKMPWPSYLLATFIGVTPFTFVFVYAAGYSLRAQLAIGAAVMIVLALRWRQIRAAALKLLDYVRCKTCE